ncbi:DedA family protein, partial [Listeria monocytogenes]|nr:DedA family protein [Listeria monocytogenes]
LGSNWSVVEKYTRPISYLMLALVIAIVVYLAYKVWNKRARNAK